ncbi:imidazoleglycerol-phosphate dehydratase [Halobacteroides halobius DSM 5150]|uniref:Imidazoleglycerol-phosphate dehydratase n=1 Tax=Halobacteroides halobius (strain ATCC 35273 / DSM 5150 / MD-1) TaxID=748449 RepID=L0K6Q9_HALHC|nr:imidazoleglycerol-phosphate dehydratase HisB [Halobacteroides halobius]AGB40952.1 imidazoleglycerol-phosphate dehydratase [Halobacteroides halobius DSM 5150]
MRQVKLERKTSETEIKLDLNLDGSGQAEIKTPVPFLNHMLELFTRHGLFDLKLKASGDVEIDGHHTVEDIGIVLGQALKEAIGDKKGIQRYGDQFVPMDEALLHTAIDFSGRFYLNFSEINLKDKVGDFDTELVEEFFRALAYNAGLNLHIRQLVGTNTHHIIEGIFKSFARALAQAVKLDDQINGVMSTKGKLE